MATLRRERLPNERAIVRCRNHPRGLRRDRGVASRSREFSVSRDWPPPPPLPLLRSRSSFSVFIALKFNQVFFNRGGRTVNQIREYYDVEGRGRG